MQDIFDAALAAETHMLRQQLFNDAFRDFFAEENRKDLSYAKARKLLETYNRRNRINVDLFQVFAATLDVDLIGETIKVKESIDIFVCIASGMLAVRDLTEILAHSQDPDNRERCGNLLGLTRFVVDSFTRMYPSPDYDLIDLR